MGPSVEVVPRGRARQELYDKADLLELKGDWNQQQIFEALECTFASVLADRIGGDPTPRFD